MLSLLLKLLPQWLLVPLLHLLQPLLKLSPQLPLVLLLQHPLQQLLRQALQGTHNRM